MKNTTNRPAGKLQRTLTTDALDGVLPSLAHAVTSFQERTAKKGSDLYLLAEQASELSLLCHYFIDEEAIAADPDLQETYQLFANADNRGWRAAGDLLYLQLLDTQPALCRLLVKRLADALRQEFWGPVEEELRAVMLGATTDEASDTMDALPAALEALGRAQAGILGTLADAVYVYERTIADATFSLDADGRLIIVESRGEDGMRAMTELSPQDTIALLQFAEPFIKARILDR